MSVQLRILTVLCGHRPRLKTSQQTIAELVRIYDAGWRSSIFFVDDNFIGNKGYLKTELLPALIEWRKDKRGCVFFTEASINLADDRELMDMMVDAGFDTVFIGILAGYLRICEEHMLFETDGGLIN